ncbi:MAG: Nif3-like dinuclear metal center hexameric protein, partial [Burkholderiaceae bacterium]|nr:Nif3-like dinuclear metal center hexameric protein [Burkholderiaceae bacterium]
MLREDLLHLLNETLTPSLFKDYAPNGLQVEGKEHIELIVTAVTATQNVIDRACELGADALLVHHGWFWRGENPIIVRTKHKRLKAMLMADMNLIAYHLPLDAHPSLGNNACLGERLGATNVERFGPDQLVSIGEIEPVSASALADRLNDSLGQKPLLLGDSDKLIRRVAWCSGAAQDFLDEAILAGADAYISGEVSERTTHLARESGVPYLA